MTTTITRAIFILALAAAAAACGGEGGPGGGDDSGGDDSGGGDDGVDPPDPEGWQTLLKGTWNLAANEEGYFCVIATVPRDVYVKSFRPLTPLGTHHTVLTRYQGSGADGTTRCSSATNGTTMVYGSGVGAPDFVFPQGVGLHLAAGTRLLLNLHLYNGSDAPLSGTSGTLFQEATASEIQHRAEIVLAGPTFSLAVPPGASTQSGTCNVNAITTVPIQVFSLSQHMHKLGRRMRTVAVRGTTEILLQDIPYNFEQQEFQILPSPIELRPGDVVRTSCTFENPTTTTVRFGESSDDEMCFTDLFYYPAQNARYICSSL
jgi:Copper type II ascorbate-dependent monooxygenase, C-terminal domain